MCYFLIVKHCRIFFPWSCNFTVTLPCDCCLVLRLCICDLCKDTLSVQEYTLSDDSGNNEF